MCRNQCDDIIVDPKKLTIKHQISKCAIDDEWEEINESDKKVDRGTAYTFEKRELRPILTLFVLNGLICQSRNKKLSAKPTLKTTKNKEAKNITVMFCDLRAIRRAMLKKEMTASLKLPLLHERVTNRAVNCAANRGDIRTNMCNLSFDKHQYNWRHWQFELSAKVRTPVHQKAKEKCRDR